MPNERDLTASPEGLNRRQRRAAARAARRASARAALPAISAGAALALSLGLQPSGAHAATFTVTNLDDDGAGSLRQALADANANPDADVITFQSGLTGTITLAAASGHLEISESVTIQGPGADQLTIDANQKSRVFYLYNPASTPVDVTITGLRITGGQETRGAGVIDWSEHLTLDSVEITGNAADRQNPQGGGGIFADQPGMELTIKNSLISGNTTTRFGGGVYVGVDGGPVTIQDTKIIDNEATQRGGGIQIGFFYGGGAVTVERSTISGNTTSGEGGGVFLYVTAGAVNIRQSDVSNNSADVGAGVYLYGMIDPVTIENCTISGNQATAARGGGVYLRSADDSVTLDHCTVTGNSASIEGGGVYAENDPITLENSIIADNTAPANPDIGADAGGFNASYNLIETTPEVGTINGTNVGNLIGQDPALGALSDNGGPTLTQLPAATSVVIDAGDPAYAGPPDVDQRGRARVVGAHADMGAVELNPGTLQCAASTISVSEGAATIGLSVTRAGGADGAASIDIGTADGTAMQPADYTQAMATLQWSNQESAAKTLNVTIVDENLAESSETFTAALSGASGAAPGTTTSVTVTITDDDAAPTIATIADQSIDQDGATSVIDFTIDDADDTESSLSVSAVSSNHDLVEDADVVLGGSGADRTIQITPKAGASGDTDVTVSVSDGTNTTTETFHVVVNAPVDEPPTITAIDDQTIDENSSTAKLGFKIGDPDTDLADLVVSAKSSKHALLADAGITLGGSGAKRTVKVKPLADKSGKVNVTISVSDGTSTSVSTFTVTVKAASNDPDQEPATDAGTGMMEPPDAGEPGGADASTGGGDASTGVGEPIQPKDAGVGESDASAMESDDIAPDGGESDAGVKISSDDGCGCSTVGATKRPSGVVITSLLGLLGLATRRRRRAPGCPRCT